MIYMLSRKRCDEIPNGFFQSLLNYHMDNLYIISKNNSWKSVLSVFA